MRLILKALSLSPYSLMYCAMSPTITPNQDVTQTECCQNFCFKTTCSEPSPNYYCLRSWLSDYRKGRENTDVDNSGREDVEVVFTQDQLDSTPQYTEN